MGRSLALTQPRPSLAMAKLRHNAQKMTGPHSERLLLFFGQARPWGFIYGARLSGMANAIKTR